MLVYRNDALTVAEAKKLAPTHLVISPGPGRPDDAGTSLAMIDAFAGTIPVLGVCLGHQSIVQHFGGEIIGAAALMHGKTSLVQHDGEGVYRDMPQSVRGGPLSLARREPREDARGSRGHRAHEDGEIMGVRHRTLAVEGVQFHPESVLTPEGPKLLENFLYRYGGRPMTADAGPAARAPARGRAPRRGDGDRAAEASWRTGELAAGARGRAARRAAREGRDGRGDPRLRARDARARAPPRDRAGPVRRHRRHRRRRLAAA